MKKAKDPSITKYKILITSSLGLMALGAVWTCYQIKNKKLPIWPLLVVGSGNLATGVSIEKAREHIEEQKKQQQKQRD